MSRAGEGREDAVEVLLLGLLRRLHGEYDSEDVAATVAFHSQITHFHLTAGSHADLRRADESVLPRQHQHHGVHSERGHHLRRLGAARGTAHDFDGSNGSDRDLHGRVVRLRRVAESRRLNRRRLSLPFFVLYEWVGIWTAVLLLLIVVTNKAEIVGMSSPLHRSSRP